MKPEKLYRFELQLITGLALILPSLEAGKTLFWFLYLCLFMYNRYKQGTLSLIPNKTANIAITLFLTTAFISTLANWPLDDGFKGALDELRFLTLFLCLYNADYTATQYRRIGLAIIVGVLAGLLYGLVEFLLGMKIDFQFHSAGILTQSSIYLGIGILLTTGLLLDSKPNSRRLSISLKIALLIQIAALLYIGSRGSLLAVTLTLVLIALLQLHLGTLFSWFAGLTVIIVLAVGLIQLFPDNVFSKDIKNQYSFERIQHSDSQRMGAWNVALAKLGDGNDLIWGVGPRNYKSINELPLIRDNKDLSKVIKFGHAHNIFLTQLIEQGLIGLFSMLFFFFLVLKKIIHQWRSTSGHDLQWSWYAGLGGLAIPIIAGSFNSPLYQEHAMLAMMVIGMMFAATASDASLQTKKIPGNVDK